VNPRAGLIWHPWQSSVFKVLYSQAYRAPNAYESDYDTADYKANHNLVPETIRSCELVWEQTLAKNCRLVGALSSTTRSKISLPRT